jgi:hypothetical protein
MGCKKDNVHGSGVSGYIVEAKDIQNGNDNITTVKALIKWYNENDEYQREIMASAEYENNSFKLALPKDLDDKYLRLFVDEFFDADWIKISDRNAKVSRTLLFNSYFEGDVGNGYFMHVGKNDNSLAWVSYRYSDRNFTVKGTYTAGYENETWIEEFDLSFKKGWNVGYRIEEKIYNNGSYTEKHTETTKKPSNINYLWLYVGPFNISQKVCHE